MTRKSLAILPALVVLALSVAGTQRSASPPAEVSRLATEIRGEVAELRGLEFHRDVPVRVIDDDEARRHLLGRLDKFQPEEELRRTQQAYELLGLLPPDVDLVAVFLEVLREQAGGFYDPDSGTFFVLDDIPSVIVPVVLAHELTHALEDQHFDIDGRLEDVIDDDDRLLARAAIHEGSATLLMSVFLARKMLAGEIDLQAMQAYQESEAAKAEVLDRLPAVFRRQLIAPYTLGASFLARGNLLGSVTSGFPVDDVDRAYANPPSSTEQILHPDLYWDPELRDEPREVDLGTAGALLGRRARRVAHGVLGELNLGVLVDAPTPSQVSFDAQVGGAWTNAAATGWGGDRWELWQRGDRLVVILGTIWDSEADAREFVEALADREDLQLRRRGTRVAVLGGDAGKRSARILRRLADGL